MITLEQIQELSSLRNGTLPISSLYLHLWPDRRIHHAKPKELIKGEQEKLSQSDLPKEGKKWVEEDLKKLQEFVATIPPDSRFHGNDNLFANSPYLFDFGSMYPIIFAILI